MSKFYRVGVRAPGACAQGATLQSLEDMTDSIIRARYRSGGAADLIEPGKV